LLQFGVIVLEFALVVAALRFSNIDSDALELVATLALGGFLVHHFLPMAWRQTFFALLSAGSVLLVLGGAQGAWLLGLGSLLIALCHLPLAFWVRVAILCGTGCALAALRVKAIPEWADLGIPATVWPILGSMFMFRLLVYLYDLKHKAAAFSPSRAAGYFFMLPNICFPLFPIVDYKTLQRSFYREDALDTYRTGIKWMARGLVQLLLYRCVYLKGLIDPSEVATGLDVARSILMTYLLYLKVSGSFHFIVGLLHMFGYSLPETHHLYLLSSSFTDFWRRINIYWKDFIQKLFFNPSYAALKRLGHERALALATVIAFVVTWFFHSYQWFWIRGSFPIVWNDVFFWTLLGLIVLTNVMLESKIGRRRSLKTPSPNLKDETIVALKTVGTFVTICVLWTIWNTPSTAELRILVDGLLNSGPKDLAVIAGFLLLGVVGVVLGSRKRDLIAGMPRKYTLPVWLRREPIPVCAVTLPIIIVMHWPALLVPASPALAEFVQTVHERQMNRADSRQVQRGYYEHLDDTTRLGDEVAWVRYKNKPAGWDSSLPLVHPNRALLGSTYPPFLKAVEKRALNTINSHGMRDRECTVRRPPNTFRIALIGASHDAGLGVGDDETYENIVEDRLNREIGPAAGVNFEILNFSVEGYTPEDKLARIERDVFEFQPHAVLYVANREEINWTFGRLGRLIETGQVNNYEIYRRVMGQVQTHFAPSQQMVNRTLLKKLTSPYAEETLLAILKRLHAGCHARGIRSALVLLRVPADGKVQPEALRRMAVLGQEARLPVLDLFDAFSEVDDLNSLWIAPWDDHTNAAGQRLLAGRLFQLLIEQNVVPTTRSAGSEMVGPDQRVVSSTGS
jgi:hypothetical protein